MTTNRQRGPRGPVNLSDIRFSVSEQRTNFTRLREKTQTPREKGPVADFITLICLISEIYRKYGEELVPIRQYSLGRETQFNQGHTSSVSHTRIWRHGAGGTLAPQPVSLEGELNSFETIIVKRPREGISTKNSYALRSFITELRVRTHPPLQDHPNIASFWGVGWDYEDAEARIPRPLLLEELAPQGSLENFWNKWHFVPLNFKAKLDLCRNVAEGLMALHGCGVVHGDVKPDNILIFPTRASDNAFIAKLTDFGHSVFESSHLNGLPAFTMYWCAPEICSSTDASMLRYMDFREMKETDYYSYGLVVLSIMISQPYYECLDMEEKLHETMLVKASDLLSKVDKEKSDSDIDLSVTSALIRRTIRLNPKHRSLKQAIQVMSRYDKANGHESFGLQFDGAARASFVSALNVAEMVTVGHATLSSTSHQLKGYIVERLLLVASDKTDPRHPAAAWELSICYFSGFGVNINFEKCSQWLTTAFEGGIVAAQHYFDVIHQAMAKPCPVTYSEGITDIPLINNIQRSPPVGLKYEEMLQDGDEDSSLDSEDDENRQTRAISPTSMPQELIDIIFEGTCEQLRLYMRINPEHINTQDAEGATPLILAAKLQHADQLEFLAKEPSTDASITTHAGQTVLHFLPLFDDELNIELVPLLVKRHASLHKEAFPAPLDTGSTMLSSGIRCCSILNAILHGNIVLLETLLEAAHQENMLQPCRICEVGSDFRRIFAIVLSMFQAEAAYHLMRHVWSNRNTQDVKFNQIRVWAGRELLLLHEVPFNNVAIRASDLPESFFRAIHYGDKYSVVLEQTIDFLLSIERNEHDLDSLMYSMLKLAVKSNSTDAVKILLEQAKQRRFQKRWWLRGPVDDSPFMLSMIYGFREVYEMFLREEPSVLQAYAELPCWEPLCHHQPTKRQEYLAALLGHSRPEIAENERKHSFNVVQRALWISIRAEHQDKFFLESLLHSSNSDLVTKAERPLIRTEKGVIQEFPVSFYLPRYEEGNDPDSVVHRWRRLDGGDFLEQAILDSLFLPAKSVTEKYPEVWLTKSPGSNPSHHKKKSSLQSTSRPSIVFVLHYGSYEQCRFVMERLIPLRGTDPASINTVNVQRKNGIPSHNEEGIMPWTRCPISPHEFSSLLLGNIKRIQYNRQELWDVIEEQVKMGHSSSGLWLKQAILRGNTDAVKEMLQRGWSANGPIWARFNTPLQYSRSLREFTNDFEYLFRQMNPDLPQHEWIMSTTHAFTYKAYRDQLKGLSWTEWERRLEVCQDILESKGGKVFWIGKLFRSENDVSLKLWSFIFVLCLYFAIFPLSLVYGTTSIWITMDMREKFGFAYLWSLLSIGFLRVLRHRVSAFSFSMWRGRLLRAWITWLPILFMFCVNYLALPILVVRFNWQPLLSCRTIADGSTEGGALQTAQTCTNHSYLLPLVAGGIEFILWSAWQEIRSCFGEVFGHRGMW